MPAIKFGTDGWRGIIADDFTYDTVRHAAQGVSEYLLAKQPDPLAVIGYDCRFGSEVFAEIVARHAKLPIARRLAASSQARELVSEDVARRYGILPLSVNDTTIDIATSNPYDFDCERSIAFTVRPSPNDGMARIVFAGTSTPAEDVLRIAEALASRHEGYEVRAGERVYG